MAMPSTSVSAGAGTELIYRRLKHQADVGFGSSAPWSGIEASRHNSASCSNFSCHTAASVMMRLECRSPFFCVAEAPIFDYGKTPAEEPSEAGAEANAL
jgi:hypothetical protein